MPRFNVYLSQCAKKRALTARRVARHRARKCNAPGVTTEQNKTAEEKREEDSSDSAEASSTGPRPTSGRATRSGPTLLGSVLSEGAGTAAFRKNGPREQLEIAAILEERGCRDSFRQLAAKRADVLTVRRLAKLFDQQRGSIVKPGGWFRDQFRRAGVKGV
jgi:hypothetical protein